MNLATLKLFCLDSQSYNPATGETSRDCRMQLVSELSLSNLFKCYSMLHFFFCKNKIYKKHEAEVRSKLISILEIQAG